MWSNKFKKMYDCKFSAFSVRQKNMLDVTLCVDV